MTLRFLWADAATDGRQVVGLVNRCDRLSEASMGDVADKTRDIDIDRTSLNTCRILALKAPRRFLNGLILGVSQRDLIEVVNPHIGLLLTHGNSSRFDHGRASRVQAQDCST